jgi:hypothetical protein
MMFDHLDKKPANDAWLATAEARHPRPLLVILPAALLSWAFIILIGIGAGRALGFWP